MKNPLPLLVAVCALAAPVFADSPQPANPSDLSVVAYGSDAQAAVRALCPSGALVVKKSENPQHGPARGPGFSVPYPLYCAQPPAAGQSSVSIVRITAADPNAIARDPAIFYITVANVTADFHYTYTYHLKIGAASYAVSALQPATTANLPAAAAPAAAQPAPTNGGPAAGYLVVIADPNDSGGAPATTGVIKAACPDGTLVISAADDANILRLNMNVWHIGDVSKAATPHCGNSAPSGVALTPTVGPSTVALIHGAGINQYMLNIGAHGNKVAVRPATASDFKPAPGPANPSHPPTPRPVPPGHVGPIKLTPHEKNWLDFDQYQDYKKRHAAAKGATELAALFNEFRGKIQLNLPPLKVDDYKSKVAALTPSTTAQFDAEVHKYKYADTDIALSASDLAKLTAQQQTDYKTELAADATQVTDAEAKLPANQRDSAHVVPYRINILKFRTTTKYRALLGGGGTTPANPDGWTHGLDNGLAVAPYLGPDLWAKYQAALAAIDADKTKYPDAATRNKAKDDVVTTYLGYLVSKFQADPTTFTQDKVKSVLATLLDVNQTDKWQKKQLCDPSRWKQAAPTAAAPVRRDAVTQADAQVTMDSGNRTATGSTIATQIATTHQVAATDVHAPATTVAAPPPPTQVAGPTDPVPGSWPPIVPPIDPAKSPVALACVPDSSVSNPPGAPPSTVPPPQQTTATTNQATTGDTPPKTGDTSAQIMSHVRSGIGGALIGIVFGTFFGPVGVLIGAAIGFGIGYAGDKYLGS